MSSHPASRRARWGRMTTRVLLTCAVFAGFQSLLFLSVAPFTGILASFAPPLYAVVAGVYSLMIFAARRFTGVAGSATVTALVTSVAIAAFSPLGLVLLVPLLVSAVLYEAVLLLPVRSRAGDDGASGPVPGYLRAEGRYVVAALASAGGLFVVSLAVFSPEHLTLPVLSLTLLGRVAGEVAASIGAGVVVRLLRRAGVRAGR